MKPEHLAKHTARIVAASRALTEDPNNMDVRMHYVRAVFNHDITAQVIAGLADNTGSEAQAEHRETKPILPKPIEGRGP